MPPLSTNHCYLRHRLASGEGIVTLGVTLCVRVRRISLGGEGNALYPVLSLVVVVVVVVVVVGVGGGV